MNSFKFFLVLLVLGLLSLACEDSTSSKSDLDIDPVVEEQATVGWEINETVLVGNEIQELTQPSNLFEDPGLGDISGANTLKNQLQRMYSEAIGYLNRTSLQKVTEDSVIFDDTKDGWGFTKRSALFFDTESGELRFIEVRYDFNEDHNLQYDSSEVIIYVGENWLVPSDERIVELYRYQDFRDDFMVQSIESRVEGTEYNGNEITGVRITVDSYYHPDRRLVRKSELVQFNSDQSGTLRQEFEFSDGTTRVHEVTFKNDGTGTFTRERRDGTVITGTFNSVEDDLAGAYSELVDFPEGRYVDRILREAEVMITLPDSVFNAMYREVVFFETGRIDSSSVGLQVEQQYNVRLTTILRTRPNGAHGTLFVRETEEETTLEGHWITWDGYYIDIEAEYYLDGSGHLHYEVYASEAAFNNEEEPLIVVDYYFSPDQSGSGTLTYEGVTYDVVFNVDGSAVISQGGNTRNLNVY